MWILALAVAVGLWAVWVAYEVNKEGGYNPFKDSCTHDCNQGRNCTCGNKTQEKPINWPFPGDKE